MEAEVSGEDGSGKIAHLIHSVVGLFNDGVVISFEIPAVGVEFI